MSNTSAELKHATAKMELLKRSHVDWLNDVESHPKWLKISPKGLETAMKQLGDAVRVALR